MVAARAPADSRRQRARGRSARGPRSARARTRAAASTAAGRRRPRPRPASRSTSPRGPPRAARPAPTARCPANSDTRPGTCAGRARRDGRRVRGLLFTVARTARRRCRSGARTGPTRRCSGTCDRNSGEASTATIFARRHVSRTRGVGLLAPRLVKGEHEGVAKLETRFAARSRHEKNDTALIQINSGCMSSARRGQLPTPTRRRRPRRFARAAGRAAAVPSRYNKRSLAAGESNRRQKYARDRPTPASRRRGHPARDSARRQVARTPYCPRPSHNCGIAKPCRRLA